MFGSDPYNRLVVHTLEGEWVEKLGVAGSRT